MAGCFTLRTPEEPTEGNFWEYPDRPNKVLDNLKYAYLYRSIDNVKNSLDSTKFEFVADPSLLSGPNQDLYKNWDYQKEIEKTNDFFQLLDLSDPLPLTIEFSYDSVDSQPHIYRYRINYSISAKLVDNRLLNAKGTSVFTLEENESGLWTIVKWEDFKDDGYLSWGELKAGDF